MATKRRALNRPARRRITPEAVAAFEAGERTQGRYLACLRGEPCDSADPGRHCAVCAEYLDASRTLSRALGLRPWEPSPIEVDDGPTPAFWDAGQWSAAQELRAALREASR